MVGAPTDAGARGGRGGDGGAGGGGGGRGGDGGAGGGGAGGSSIGILELPDSETTNNSNGFSIGTPGTGGGLVPPLVVSGDARGEDGARHEYVKLGGAQPLF